MKKITLSVALLLGSYVAKAQTEYIDVAKVGMLGTSTMAIYNDDKHLNDLQVFKLNLFDKSKIYHWVKYTNLYNDRVVLTMSDDPGDVRRVCTKHDEQETFCETVPSFATTYEFTTSSTTFQIWISRPNTKNYE
tara:strand:+ start:157 stop:558 length:402 start_codon:yes stop_codon:yes gene_type:complete